MQILGESAQQLANIGKANNTTKREIMMETTQFTAKKSSASWIYENADNGLRLSVSTGNSKLGKIPQVNLTPVASCRKFSDLPCAAYCYARKAVRLYPQSRTSWAKNFKATKVAGFFKNSLNHFLAQVQPDRFRFHSAGDWHSQEYLDSAMEVARENPNTRFLSFTKQWELDYTARPANFVVIFSSAPGWKYPEFVKQAFDGISYVDMSHKFDKVVIHLGKAIKAYQTGKQRANAKPIADIVDELPILDKRIPDGAFVCPGSCVNCDACWNVKTLPVNAIVFPVH